MSADVNKSVPDFFAQNFSEGDVPRRKEKQGGREYKEGDRGRSWGLVCSACKGARACAGVGVGG